MCNYTVFKIFVLVNLLSLIVFQADAHAVSDRDRVKENIRILQKTKACPGCDLAGADLNRMDLSGANLQGAVLTEVKLYLVNFSGANLQNAHLQRASLGGADLAGADLRGADLQGAELNGAYLAGAKFDGEFVKTKPFEEGGTSAIENNTNVNNAVETKKTRLVAEDKNKKKVLNEQKAASDKRKEQADVPPVKTDEPIKSLLVSENLQPSNDPGHQTANDKKENLVQSPQKELDGAAGSSKDRDRNDDAEKKAESQESDKSNAVPSAVTSHDTNSLPPAEVKDDQSHADPSVEKGNTQNATGRKMHMEEPSSITASGNDQPLVEKDLLKEKQGRKEENNKTITSQSEEISTEKTNNLKKLLKTKKCYQCDLAGVDLSDKNLNEADLEGANLTGSNLEKTDLSKAVLKGALLIKANLKNANLKGADLYKADLSGADLTDANMENAQAEGALFVGAIGR